MVAAVAPQVQLFTAASHPAPTDATAALGAMAAATGPAASGPGSFVDLGSAATAGLPLAAAAASAIPAIPLEARKIFIHGLEPKLTADVLKEGFSEFGTVAEVFVAKDDLGMPKKFGFITFDTQETAQKALNAGNHTVQDVKLQIKTATPMNRSSAAMKSATAAGVPPAAFGTAASPGCSSASCAAAYPGYAGYATGYAAPQAAAAAAAAAGAGATAVPGYDAYLAAAYGAAYAAQARNAAAYSAVYPGMYGAMAVPQALTGFGAPAYGCGAQMVAAYGAQPAGACAAAAAAYGQAYGPAVAQLQPASYAPY